MRERGSLRLQETLRQVRILRDRACSKRSWQEYVELCRLEEGCASLSASPGEAHAEVLPWIIRRSEHACVTDVLQLFGAECYRNAARSLLSAGV